MISCYYLTLPWCKKLFFLLLFIWNVMIAIIILLLCVRLVLMSVFISNKNVFYLKKWFVIKFEIHFLSLITKTMFILIFFSTPSQRISLFFVPKWTLIFLFYFWVITTIFWGNEMGSSSVVRYVSPLPNISYIFRWNYYCVCVPWKFK